MRKISTEIGSSSRIVGEEKAVEYVAKAGFEAWDFSMGIMVDYDREKKCIVPCDHPLCGPNYLAFARKLKHIGLECGIPCNQSHAPYPCYFKERKTYYLRSIECTAEAGGNTCIIHPDYRDSVEHNKEMYLELVPFAKQCGVKIACENLYDWDHETHSALPSACSDPESFVAHIDAVNSPYLVACLDIGHAEMKGLNTSAADMVYALKERLGALHIHDNDKWHDSHQIPFSMSIDYGPITKALKDIDYKGDFTLECDTYLAGVKETDLSAKLSDMVDAVKKFRNMFNEA